MTTERLTAETKFYRRYAKKLIQDARADAQLTYEELAARLRSYGVRIETQVLINRINRGSFSFVFALQVLAALRVRSVPIPDPPADLEKPPRRR